MKTAFQFAVWFLIGFGSCFLLERGRELREAERVQLGLRAALARANGETLKCNAENKKWEELVQQWGAEQSRCDAVLDFNKTIDVLEKETAAQKGKRGKKL